MGEQSDFSQVTEDGVQNDTNHESEATTSPSDSTTGSDNNSNSDITKLTDSAVKSWVAERKDREEDYGYFHLFVVAKSDLSGVERQLHYEEELDQRVSEDDSSHQYGGRWGKGGVYPAEVRDRLIDWKFSELATPHHPDLRTISAENLRIFVAEPARDLLREQDSDIDPLIKTLNNLVEHEPTDEQLATHREHKKARELVMGHQAPLNQRVRAIETTIRARFDFSRRYGGDVPDPHPDYCDLDPNELEAELKRARTELEQTEQRKKNLRKEIKADEAQWVEERRAQLFE